MNNTTASKLLSAIYTLALAGIVLACGGFAFLVGAIDNPNVTARTATAVFGIAAVIAAAVAVGSRIGMRVFYDRVCGAAFAAWASNPTLGDAIDAATLAELAGLPQASAWHARQFLERKSVAEGVRYELDPTHTPNLRRYRFPRKPAEALGARA